MPDPKEPAQQSSASGSVNIVSGRSDVGLKRSENQDRWVSFGSAWGECLLVADGMGGHRGGERAAELVVLQFPRYLNSVSPDTELPAALNNAFRKTNSDVYQEGHGDKSEVRDMGSTFVLAVLREHDFVVAHCGDSRAYLLRSGRLTRLTEDHTVGNKMVRAGILTADQALNHPDSGLLTRSVGQEPDLELAISAPQPLSPGDFIMLCSDGLSGHIKDREIERAAVRSNDPSKMSQNLIDLALASGGKDNITVVVARHGAASGFSLSRWLPGGYFRGRGAGKIMAGGFAAVTLAIIGFGLKFDIVNWRKTGGVLQPVSQGAAAARVVPGPSADKQPADKQLDKQLDKQIKAGVKSAPTRESAAEDRKVSAGEPPRVEVQLLVASENALSPKVRDWCAAFRKKNLKDYFYRGRVWTPDAAPGDSYSLLKARTAGTITVLYNGKLCTPAQLSGICGEIEKETGVKPAQATFSPTTVEVGKLAHDLTNVGILVLLSSPNGSDTNAPAELKHQ